jgi:hypothetical protein
MKDDDAAFAEVEHRIYRDLLAAYADEREDQNPWASTRTPSPNLTKKEASI